jgi:hypothetical protein
MQRFAAAAQRLHAAVDGVRFNFMGTATAGGAPALDASRRSAGAETTAIPPVGR